jgi:ubiquinone/menaquinone biosynthesis C-methylase UbiE
MNENHTQLCPSPGWAAHIQDEVLPSLTSLAPLGEEMLELGPGPGAATEWLRHKVRRLVCVEPDQEAVEQLERRFSHSNVELVVGDATDLDFADESFDSVGTFTMLHHVATAQLQQRVLEEAHRVLRPGGTLLGSDSLASNDLHLFHAEDTYNPVDPASLLVRLQAVGFTSITLFVDYDVRFVAQKSDDAEACLD